ncbi:MAG: HIT family protein [Parvibaculales bacterium]
MNESYDRDNIFAKILRGELPCIKVYEDDLTLAFMDVMPQSDGHTLVIPKNPSVNMLDIAPADAAALIKTVHVVAPAVKQAMQAEGIQIVQLNGPTAGQTVFHTHFHIIPRNEGLEMRFHAKEMEDPAVLERHAGKIRAALG